MASSSQTDAPASATVTANANAGAGVGAHADGDSAQIYAGIEAVCAFVAAQPPEDEMNTAAWKKWENACLMYVAAYGSGSVPQCAADLSENVRRRLGVGLGETKAKAKTRIRGLKPVVTRLRPQLATERPEPELEAWRQRAIARGTLQMNLSAPTGVHARLGAAEVTELLEALSAGVAGRQGSDRVTEATFAETVEMFNMNMNMQQQQQQQQQQQGADANTSSALFPVVRSAHTIAAWLVECILAPAAGVQSLYVFEEAPEQVPGSQNLIFLRKTIEAHLRKRDASFIADVRAQAASLSPTTAAQQAEQALAPRGRAPGDAPEYEPEASAEPAEPEPVAAATASASARKRAPSTSEAEPEPEPEPKSESARHRRGARAHAPTPARKRKRSDTDSSSSDSAPRKRVRRAVSASEANSASDSASLETVRARLRKVERRATRLAQQLRDRERAQARAKKTLEMIVAAMELYEA